MANPFLGISHAEVAEQRQAILDATRPGRNSDAFEIARSTPIRCLTAGERAVLRKKAQQEEAEVKKEAPKAVLPKAAAKK